MDRDGDVNPEIWTIPDHKDFDALMDAVLTLGLAFYLTDDERYAAHAARLLRVWFLDEDTRMNPHLEFAQGIRGINTGRGIGLIETRELAQVVEAVGLIQASNVWGEMEQQGLQKWSSDFLHWLLTSKNGQAEVEQANNHGTWYDAQVIALALFTGQLDLAREVLRHRAPQRLAGQIEPDGRQPHEMQRTLSWHYCVFNLQAWYRLATFGKLLGIDLWHQEVEGRSLRKATDYLLPYLQGECWPYQQSAPQKFEVLAQLLCQAAVVYAEPHYLELARGSPGVDLTRARALLIF